MRSDYVLYGVAIIFFIIAGAVAAAQIPGYELTATNGMVVIVLFLLIGIVSAAVGYSARPKAIMPRTQPSPPPATTEVQETPTQAPSIPEEMTPPPPPPPTPIEAEEVTQEPTPPSPPPEEIPVTPTAEPEEPMKAAEEEKPKPARRRRRKKAEG